MKLENHFVFHGREDEALCLNMDSRYFIVPDTDQLLPSERTLLLAEVKPDLAEGVKICLSCPIRDICLATSTAGDRHWTVRGGQWPTGAGPKPVVPRQRVRFRSADRDTPEVMAVALRAWLEGFGMSARTARPDVNPQVYEGSTWRETIRTFKEKDPDCLVQETHGGDRTVAAVALALSRDGGVLSAYRPAVDGRWRRKFYPKDRFVLEDGVAESLPVLVKWGPIK